MWFAEVVKREPAAYMQVKGISSSETLTADRLPKKSSQLWRRGRSASRKLSVSWRLATTDVLSVLASLCAG
jgi:hypothetical protein